MAVQRYVLAVALAWLGGVTGATPVAVWLIGDQSSAAAALGPAYIPPAQPIAQEVVLAAGILGALILVVTVVAIRRYPLTYIVFGVMVLVGVILGATYRVLNADVIGANIGAGLAILFALPLAGVLALVGTILAFLLRPRVSVAHAANVSGRQETEWEEA